MKFRKILNKEVPHMVCVFGKNGSVYIVSSPNRNIYILTDKHIRDNKEYKHNKGINTNYTTNHKAKE